MPKHYLRWFPKHSLNNTIQMQIQSKCNARIHLIISTGFFPYNHDFSISSYLAFHHHNQLGWIKWTHSSIQACFSQKRTMCPIQGSSTLYVKPYNLLLVFVWVIQEKIISIEFIECWFHSWHSIWFPKESQRGHWVQGQLVLTQNPR